ncbi:MAG: fumarylacetoacetate hydrolase family protein [Kineosporiaceae bacterium]
MRLLTLRLAGTTRAARLEADGTAVLLDSPDVGALLALPDWRTAAAGGGEHLAVGPDATSADLAPVVPRPAKVVCVGLNYAAHVAETGSRRPEHPMWFTKFAASLAGPRDDLPLPPESDRVDWEAELAVVIGAPGRRIPRERALDHVAGYAVLNDVSMRDWQRRTSQYLAGKAWDRCTPVGPWLTTADELPAGAAGLRITCEVDGEVMQDSRTDDLVFDVATLVADLSTVVTLEPGDLVATGTPGGVGMGRTPPRFLAPGSLVRTSVEGIGTLENHCVAG